MFAENGKISLRQMQALLLLDCFGTAVLFLPAAFAQLSGRACWLLALVCGGCFALLSLLLTTAIIRIGKRYPDGMLVEWCRGGFGRFFGNLLLLGLGVKLLLDGAAELRSFGEILCRMMLPATPLWMIVLVILAVSDILAAQGLEGRGRAAEILLLFTAIPLVLIWLAVACSAEYGRMLPLSLPAWAEIRAGLPAMSVVLQGLLFLYFIPPYLKKPQKMRRAVLHSTLLSAGIAAAAVLLSLAAYGVEILAEKPLPALQMMERVGFSGIFLTRQDIVLLWFWFASVCMFLSGTIFFGSLLGLRMLHQGDCRSRYGRLAVLVLLFAAALLPQEFLLFWRNRLSPWGNGIYFLLLPLLLLLAARKGGKENA